MLYIKSGEMKLYYLFFIILLLIPVSSASIPLSIDTSDGVISIDLISMPDLELPCPCAKPILRPYQISKDHDIWHAQYPSSYVTPSSQWVQYYAKNNIPIRLVYRTDDEVYNNPPNGDVWQNADYTLFTGYGDCEDLAIAEVSIDIAKGRKAVVVGGYVTLDNGQRIRDFWEEVVIDGVKTIKPTNPALQTQTELRLEPKFMFNDKIEWSNYNENWYKLGLK